MIIVEPITPHSAFLFKATRLHALRESPHAFGSTYERELQFPDFEWLRRAERMNGEAGVGFLAMDGDTPCGLVGSFLDENDPGQAQLVSMWTDPKFRRQGVGHKLVDQVLHWARRRNVHTLLLFVTGNNDAAMRFYEQLGFARTGRTQPYPNDPSVVEYEMSRQVV